MKLNVQLFDAITNDKPLLVLKLLSWGADPMWANASQEGRTALHQVRAECSRASVLK